MKKPLIISCLGVWRIYYACSFGLDVLCLPFPFSPAVRDFVQNRLAIASNQRQGLDENSTNTRSGQPGAVKTVKTLLRKGYSY